MLNICKPKKSLSQLFIITLVFYSVNTNFAQIANIDVGNFHIEWRENAQFFGGGSYSGPDFTGEWPAGWYRSGTIGWLGVGVAYDVLYRYTNDIDASAGIDTLRRELEYAPEVDGARQPIREIRKYRPPQVVVDGIPFRPYKGEVDPNLPATEVVKSTSITGWGLGGCWFKITVYAFDNPNFDDFIIIDYNMVQKLNFTKQNEGPNGPTDQMIKQWFSPICHFSPTRYGFEQYEESWSYLDTWTDYIVQASKLVPPGTTPRDSMIISYAVDSNDPRPGGSSNFGDPLPGIGFVSTQYVGFTLLYADKSAIEKVDDLSQPLNVTTYFIDDAWNDQSTGILWDWATTPSRWKNPIGTPALIDPNVSDNQMGRISYQWIGPYNMGLNDSIHFVIALGAGGIDPIEALDLGKDWMNGNISDSYKDSIISTGLDSLVSTLDKAKWAWTNFQTTGEFGIPQPLPAPDIDVTSGPGWNTVIWGYPDASMFNDPKTNSDDFQEWRVYQKRGDYLVNNPNDNGFQNYHLIFSTTDRNVTSFRDTSVIRGENYHYYITAVNKEGLESSRFANRTLYAATPFKPGINSSDNVKIVPNPYIINAGALNFSEPNQIKFFNLPPYCTLKIYNEIGDIIKIIDHISGSGDESWNQLTESNEYVASGVYILSVQNATDINNRNLPTRNYKFVIIR